MSTVVTVMTRGLVCMSGGSVQGVVATDVITQSTTL